MRSIISAAALVLLVLSKPAIADGLVVVGKTPQGAIYLTWLSNRIDLNNARNELFDACNRQAFNCQEIAHIMQACFAFAASSNGAYGYTGGETEQSARSAAMNVCRNHGGSYCQITASFCETEAPRLWAQFNSDWQACFSGSIDGCNSALQYYNLNTDDRRKIDTQVEEMRAESYEHERIAREQAEAQARQERERQVVETRRQLEPVEAPPLAYAPLPDCVYHRSHCNLNDTSGCEALLRDCPHDRDRGRSILEHLQREKERQAQFKREQGQVPPPVEAQAKQRVPSYNANPTQAAFPINPTEAAFLPLFLTPLVSLLISLRFAGWPVIVIARELLQRAYTRAVRSSKFTVRFVRAFRVAYATTGSYVAHEAPPPMTHPATSTTFEQSIARALIVVPPEPLKEEPETHKTAEAVTAIELAFSYMREFQDEILEHVTDAAFMAEVQQTLALMSKQIKAAEKADPTATITIENADGSPLTIDIRFLKAHALLYEGITYVPTNMKRGVKILRQAEALEPTSAPLYYWIGNMEAAQLNKRAATAAFQKAVALDPTNIGYRKALDRVGNISKGSIAVDRAFSAGRKTMRVARLVTLVVWAAPFLMIGGGLMTGNYPAAIAGFAFMIIGGLALKGMDRAKGWFRENM